MGEATARAKPPARRKSPQARQAEIVLAAAEIAVSDGLDRLTAKRVAESLGVFPGLVNHYFHSVDDLIAAGFAQAAAAERAVLYDRAQAAGTPLAELRELLGLYLLEARDPVSLLWLDAWQASRRRPALLAEVTRQMDADTELLAGLIERGVADGIFTVVDAPAAAVQIMALIDGLSVQSAIRSTLDYTAVAEMVVSTTERLVGVPPGTLGTA